MVLSILYRNFGLYELDHSLIGMYLCRYLTTTYQRLYTISFLLTSRFYLVSYLFFSEGDIDIECLVKSWVNKQPEEKQVTLQAYIETYFLKGKENNLLLTGYT